MAARLEKLLDSIERGLVLTYLLLYRAVAALLFGALLMAALSTFLLHWLLGLAVLVMVVPFILLFASALWIPPGWDESWGNR